MQQRRRRISEAQTAAFALCASVVWTGASAAGPTLPVPCVPGSCGSSGPSQWVTGGAASAVAMQNALKINQATNSAILNWSSFNIGAGSSVTFQQPSSSSIALNRIFQSSPSQIFGQLTANGQVYLVNLNGFVFGPNSTVNVGSLLASSLPLNLTDASFTDGILSPGRKNQGAAFDATLDALAPGGREVVLDLQGSPVLDSQGNPIPVEVMVQPGAQITAADQGRLLLTGQKVINGGSLAAPDGQIILAAGAKVFLQASADPNLRGLVVEVDKQGADDVAWNQLTGALSAPRGNVTLVGLAVNQDGRISATTSVSANGSIRLEAAENAQFTGTNSKVVSTAGGKLTIGPQSDMEILPELSSSDTAVPAQAQMQSSVTLLGEQVFLKGGSIVAPGGNLTAIAAADPSAAAASVALDSKAGVSAIDPNARLRLDSGVSIDLSGSQASLPVTANLVPVQLRSSELADDPTQRNGALHGLTVYVDARNKPSPKLADVSSDVAAVPLNVAQRTENGGNAVFQSAGDVVFSSGANVNVSGGSSTYAGGVLQTSFLIGANGKLYPIATANPLMSYVGVLNPTFSQTYNKWGVKDVLSTPGLSTYQPGYVQGAKAGTVQFAAPAMVLQGGLQGSAVNGLYQRTPATAVSGGQLIIGLPGGLAGASPGVAVDYLSPAIQFTRNPVPIVTSDDSSLPQPLPLYFPTSYLTDTGFTSTQIFSNRDVTLPAGPTLNLPPGSTLAVDAARVNIFANITDPGGTLSFQNVYNTGSLSNDSGRPGVFVGDGVTLDVSGLWTNDLPAAGGSGLAQTWQNGGKIDLEVSAPGALLSIGNDVALRANGGAWLNAKARLAPGLGGSITLSADGPDSGLDVGNRLAISGFGVEGAAGGIFNLTAPRIEVSAANGSWTQAQQVDDTLSPGGFLQIHSGLFSDYGFQNFNINASGLVASGALNSALLSVDPGTSINAMVSTLYVSSRAYLRPSAATIDGLATVTTLPTYLRPGAGVSLSALPATLFAPTVQLGNTPAGDVVIGAGASITTDAGGSIGLNGLNSLIVDGVLRAPGGNVALQTVSPSENNNAYGSFEAGFLPNQRIEVGAAAEIDVSGTFVPRPSPAAQSLDLGTLYGGGTVSLFADRGAVVAERGSVIAVAGTSAPLDVLQANDTYGHEVASSAGGSIIARSGQAIFLLGDIQAAGGGGGTSGPAAAGSLEVDLTRSESWWGVTGASSNNNFNQGPLTVELLPQLPPVVGLPALLFDSNQAMLGAADLSQWGLDALRIEAGSFVSLAGNFSLALNRSIVIDSPVILATSGAQASLSAPYVELGYPHATPPNTNLPAPGTGSVRFAGGEVDLVGTTVFQGISNVGLSSSGDILLRGPGSSAPVGEIAVAGNLTLDAARIYPVSATSFTLDAERPQPDVPGSVTIGQTGPNPGAPFSAGGAVTITAGNIASTGTIYAPFGSIQLQAANSLTLGDGSLTSVSGNGLTIPYGQTQFNVAQWNYQTGQVISGVPTRAVDLNAPTVTLTKNATIDLSGGGDLLAYEWVPGSGGTRDQLAPGAGTNPGDIPGLYAILPSTRGQASPQDPLYAQAQTIASGASVYLSGGNGLASGVYPLLPARYALVPGAYLIQAEPGMVSTVSGSLGSLADGTPVVAGYYSYGSTGLHRSPGYTGFAIYPGSYGERLAQYDVSVASSYFSAAASLAGKPRPPLPADAGSLSINVGSALDASGLVVTAAATGGLAASIAISANDLVVGTPTGPVPSDAVSIQGSVLTGWQPGSLLLGGTTSSDGSTIDVRANSVTVGSGTTLTADQIVVVAKQSVDVQNGATLQTTSAASGITPSTAPAAKSVVTVNDGGTTTGAGLLALSDLNWLIPTVESLGGAATVAVESGASIGSRGSLSVSGPGGVTLGGTLTGPGAEWSLGASSIAFVPAGSQADALSIGPALLAQLGTASAVRLASTGAIDLMAPIALGVDSNGNPTLKSLTIAASSLNNQTAAGSVATQLGAQTLMLQGLGATASPVTAGPAGATLSLTAGELDIGPGPIAINGFGSTQASVAGAVVGKGTGGLSVGGDLSLSAAGVTAASGADTDINASGALAIAAANGNAAKIPTLLGGALALSGTSVDIAGTVTAPSGIVKITATGGGVNIEPGAAVSTAGRMVSIGNQSVGTQGGDISINAGGDLTLGAGAALDVSGAGAGAGGALSLSSHGAAAVAATLKGSGGAGAAGGSFSLDAGSLPQVTASSGNPITGLAASLGSGGFSNAIDIRARTGSLSLDSGSSLSAGSVALTADTGFVAVGGGISATSGALRSSLSIFGGNGVELQPGAALHADGSGSSGLGGTIEIGAGQLISGQSGTLDSYNNASIRLDAGSTISAAGVAGKGTVLLRAPALLASNDIAIQTLASDTSGVGAIVVEPVLPFNTSVLSNPAAPSAADLQSVQQAVANYMTAASPAITARLASANTPLSVQAGVELIATGALTLQSADQVSPALDLSTWHTSNGAATGAPVDFTVRAAGDINIANTVTDGFGGTQIQPLLLPGLSSSIRLVSGADLAGANPLSVLPGTGTLTIGPNAVVRTGTGDIDLVAGRNIVIGGPGSGAYTAGTPAIAPGGDASNPYPNIPPNLGVTQPEGVLIPRTNMLISFPTNGGNLLVRAGEDIVGAVLTTPSVSSWQLREGGNTSLQSKPMWGVNLAPDKGYDWNFGTLGGGDLRIAAGHDALNVTAAAAGSLLPQYGGGTQYVTSGGLSFTAGHDIGRAEVFLADGKGTVGAGGALTATVNDPGSGPISAGSAFFLQSSSLDVTARLGMVVDGVFNPTDLGQLSSSTVRPLQGQFLSYDDHSSLSLQSISGDVALGGSANAAATLLGIDVVKATAAGIDHGVVPPTLTVQALGGNISFGPEIGQSGTLVLAPSAHGQLELLAAQDITAALGAGKLTMSDAVPGSYPSVRSPFGTVGVGNVNALFAGNIHGSDIVPALVTAGGSIQGLTLSIPKAGQVVAGTDITDFTYSGQNLGATDLTFLTAGRDFSYSQAYTSGNGISVGGPGNLEILAGRSVSLGLSNGVATTGNLLNPNLPSAQGANVTIVTGTGTQADFKGFLDSIIAPSPAHQADLVSYVESLQGSSGLSFATAEAAFQSLAPQQQQPLIDKVFFNELLLSGRAQHSSQSTGFARGYAAIDALFPASRSGSKGVADGSYAGDLTLAFSRIYTLSGGDINLIVPGGFQGKSPSGLVDVGLANPPSSLNAKLPSQLGIVAQGSGNVNVYSKADVNVNASRIFTLGGGNILIWSDEGNIDAGRGSKSAVSAPPPNILISSDGTVTQDFSGAAAGSGIRTIQTNPNQARGSVDLIAPVGVIDAGDAGIGAAGNINLASRAVVGLDNISFGGTATGVPAEVSNLGASLSGASSAGSGATTSATSSAEAAQRAEQNAAAPLSQTALSWLDVFVTGLGEENCRTDDLDCMKRQKTNIN